MLRIAVVASNYLPIGPRTTKGPELFLYSFLNGLQEYNRHTGNLAITLFASGDSAVGFPLEHIGPAATSVSPGYNSDHQKLMELALLSKAFSRQSEFDLYHIHINNGEAALPFSPFITKPIAITMHGVFYPAEREFLDAFAPLPHVLFVPISESQKRVFPTLRYAQTIPHGLDLTLFSLDGTGGETMMWAGRAVPEKGADIAIDVASATGRHLNLFAIVKPQWHPWFQKQIQEKSDRAITKTTVTVRSNVTRDDLVGHYQKSKLLLFPISWEEPFGLVLIEAMACGTPIVAYARGSTPEIVCDGKTGFLVNPGKDDIRGSWSIKQTGPAGLAQAVKRIYQMPGDEYQQVRRECRKHVEKYFGLHDMVQKYVKLYQSMLG